MLYCNTAGGSCSFPYFTIMGTLQIQVYSLPVFWIWNIASRNAVGQWIFYCNNASTWLHYCLLIMSLPSQPGYDTDINLLIFLYSWFYGKLQSNEYMSKPNICPTCEFITTTFWKCNLKNGLLNSSENKWQKDYFIWQSLKWVKWKVCFNCQ